MKLSYKVFTGFFCIFRQAVAQWLRQHVLSLGWPGSIAAATCRERHQIKISSMLQKSHNFNISTSDINMEKYTA